MQDSEIVAQLQTASQDLLWYSESEYPFKTIYWENINELTTETLLEHTDHNADAKVETNDIDQFFAQATKEQDWFNEEEMAECKRYQALVQYLKTHLTNIKVYRVGETEIDCYILGKTESGAIAGLSTMVVET